ncbi:TRAP transporter large permease [Pararhizobium sp. IMCC21322]|uniref:TRAP transporter large permease n=1 Tax=Pararhizobium sp. IMCC21322 TaxID=3067903 RepID=UPI002740BD10|nr:TRAP transporter large permease [Pararhizobium sp. IMCC21322]
MLVASIMLLALIVGVLIGLPIFAAMGLSTMSHFFETGRESTLIILNQRLFDGVTSFTFLAVPMFILAGEIMTKGALIDRLLDVARAFVGHLQGGLAQVNILSSVFFAGISGSGQADIAAMGSTMMPAMEKEGYPRAYAATVTAQSATLSPTLPPSIVMVVYGAVFGVPVAALFGAGITVGFFMACAYMVCAYFMTLKYKIPKHPRASWRQVVSALRKGLVPLGMPFIILFGIFGGLFTTVESASIAVLYAMITTMLVYRTVTIAQLGPILISAAVTSAAVVIISGVALSFSYIVAIQNIPEIVLDALLGVTSNQFAIISMIIAVLLIAGMFVGRTANILLFGPIIIPIFYEFGFTPVHTGMIIIIVLGVGHLTPPVGGAILTACLIGRVTIADIMKYMWPVIILEVVLAIIIIFIPAITEFLPRMFELGGLIP